MFTLRCLLLSLPLGSALLFSSTTCTFNPQDKTDQHIICKPSEPIYFDFDSIQLSRGEIAKLEEVAQCLRGDHAAPIMLAGHADDGKTLSYNITLGETRARRVYDILLRLQVPSSLLSTISYGSERPTDDGQHHPNRRVEFEAR